MVILNLNILGTNVYNRFPLTYTFDSIKESINFLREQSFNILSWSHTNYGILKNCKIGINILEIIEDDSYWSWDFLINCKNIRECKPYLNLDREEFESLLKQKNRDDSINEILDI